MLIIGSLLAVAAGLAYSGAAALEKREGLRAGVGVPVTRLLQVMARRPWWLAAMAVSIVAWLGQTAALVLAPIAAVAPLLAAGRALLIPIGIRWFGERFSKLELTGVALVLAGAAVAAATAGWRVTLAPLSNSVQLLVGGLALAVGLAVGLRRTGIAYGTAAGVMYAATAVFTKEIGDRFAEHSWAAMKLLALSPAPWLLLVLAAIAQAYVQAGLQRTNAGSVTSACSGVTMIGLVLAGFLLYQEPYPDGVAGFLLGAAIAAATAGTILLGMRSRDHSSETVKAEQAHLERVTAASHRTSP